MSQKLTKRNEGFTIIEVMIVLAIAGLILLIVFLAVPALQRNSRNTQRKNDVAALMGGVSEFVNNNDGQLPTKLTYASGTYTFGCAAGSTCATSEAKVGYYTGGTGGAASDVNLLAAYANTGPFTSAPNDRVVIDPAAACSTVTKGLSAGGSARQIVAIYEVETGATSYGGACQES